MIRIRVIKLKQILFGLAMLILIILILSLLIRAIRLDNTGKPTDVSTVTWAEDLPDSGTSALSADMVSRSEGQRPATDGGLSDKLLSMAALLWPNATKQTTSSTSGVGEDTLPTTADMLDSDGHGDTKVNPDIQIRLKNVEDDMAPLTLNGNGPLVLLYHTHSFEAYTQNVVDTYVETEKWRTRNTDYNISAVGDVIDNILTKQYSIPVLHDTTDHETPKLGTAYVRSLVTLEKMHAEYPSIQIAIDVHRDAEIKGDTEPDTVTDSNGNKVARILFVIGTAENGSFTEKPDWENNYKVALRLTNKLNSLVPGIAMPVDVRTGRYNQYVVKNSVLVEIGHNGNTLEEAEGAAAYLAEAIASIVDPAAGAVNSTSMQLIPQS